MGTRLRLFAAAALMWAGQAAAVPTIQTWTTSNGAKVLFVETHQLPIVQAQVTFDAGSARDKPEKAGLARLTNHMLMEGVEGMDADQIAEHFDGLGAEMGATSLRDMGLLQLRSLSDRKLLDPALEVFARLYAAPTFPETNLARELARAKLAVVQEKSNPAAIAEKEFMKAVYRDHPYAVPPGGTEETLDRIARHDLVAFHRQYYVGKNAVISLVGDLTPDAAHSVAERLMKGVASGAKAADLPPVKDLEKGQTVRYEFPSSQTHFLMGQPGVYRGDPDYFPLYVGNYILGGGGLVAILSQEVREKKGLAYSAYSGFSPMRRKGPFELSLQTKNDQLEQAQAIAIKVLKDFVASGPTEQQLEKAKKHITGGFPLNIDSNKKIAGYLGVIGFYGLPINYLDEFIDNINAVTVAQIRDAWQRRIHPRRMVTVIVGEGVTSAKP